MAALVLLASALVALAIAGPGRPLGAQAGALLHLWLFLSWAGAALGALSPKAEPPELLAAKDAKQWTAQTLCSLALWRVPGVYFVSSFLGLPVGVAGSLAVGVALSLAELCGLVVAASLVRAKARRAWAGGYVALVLGAGLVSALLRGLWPSHWIAGLLHVLSGEHWALFPPSDALGAVIEGRGAWLSWLGAGGLAGLGLSLGFLWRAPGRASVLAVLASLALCGAARWVHDPARADEEAGRLGARAAPSGIVGKRAPEWQVSQHNQSAPPRLADHEGEVRVLYFFQRYCPGCVSWGFPTTTQIESEFAAEGVATLYLQTTFDLAEYNTYEAAREEVESWHALGPVAQDASIDGDPLTMRNYRARGTPWTTIIDRGGVVRFSGPTPSAAFQRGLLRELLAETR
jgi:hypothetical protein